MHVKPIITTDVVESMREYKRYHYRRREEIVQERDPRFCSCL